MSMEINMLRKIVTSSLILGLFAGNICFAVSSSGYTKASKPELTLTIPDISIIEKAIENDFKGLTKKEKKKIKGFLVDYINSVKQKKAISVNPTESKGADEGIEEY